MTKLMQREDGLWTVLDPKGLALTRGLPKEEARRIARRLNRKDRNDERKQEESDDE